MGILINEELKVLLYFFICEEQLLIWVKTLKNNPFYNTRYKILRAIVKIMSDFCYLAKNTQGSCDLNSNRFDAIQHACQVLLPLIDVDRTDNNFEQDLAERSILTYSQQIAYLGCRLEMIKTSKSYNEESYQAAKNWVEFYKIFCKIYFELYPEEKD